MIVGSLNGIKNARVLDLCCRDGVHSFTALRCGASVIALDYSDASINLAKIRAETLGVSIDFRCADFEKLPFSDSTFDTITCAGSLSYLDHTVFFKEVKRVLKREGKFIVVDSFNHNIIYRLNRFVHFIRGRRSYMTLKKNAK
jgi:ubiquinone/menaquinone biosynthesis C-methylase UbiE